MTAPLFDTHTHLGDPVFDEDRTEVLSRARKAGVRSVVVVTETLDEVDRNLRLADAHPELRLAFGLYPTHLDPEQAERFVDAIRGHRERLVAIGEVGLDRWKVKDEEDRRLQRELFCRFIDLAREVDLPLNVHSRSAGHYAVDLLIGKAAPKAQMHAFDGKVGHALRGIEAGFYFSVPPSIARSAQKQKLIRALPMERLLLETDSPVLGPDREQRNEPANVVVALNAIAEIKELEVERVRDQIHENTLRLYGDAIL